ncbi:MAG: [protein-PII] uridylyltransferase [Pseudomonadota bacterium]
MLNALLPARRPTPQSLVETGRSVSLDKEIADPAALADALDAAAIEAQEAGKNATPALLAVAKDALTDGEARIKQRFLTDGNMAETCMRDRALLIDIILQSLTDTIIGKIFPIANPTVSERLTILAVGGYGRGELAPYSDIDLLFLLPYKRSPTIEQIVETMLYILWDTGLKVGHATRSLTECMRAAETDITIRTSLLDARPLWGDDGLWDQFRRGFDRQFGPSTGHAFAVAKLAERDDRHKRMGDSRYNLEPNIKEGKGGLRDLHTLFWIAKYFYRDDAPDCLVEAGVITQSEVRAFRKARTFLGTVRCHLHYIASRPDEILTFDMQIQIANHLGYADRAGVSGVERFMKHYFLVAKQVGDLTRIVCAGLELDTRPRSARRFLPFGNTPAPIDGFLVRSGRIDVSGDDHFDAAPLDLIRIFSVAHAQEMDIHPHALKLIRRTERSAVPPLRNNAEANELFLELLASKKNPVPMLRRMSESGVLGRFVPDFGRVIAQMQYDMYHVYTVDEHTIRALGILHDLTTGAFAERMPLASRVISELESHRTLAVAVFLHDIAKGRGGDHSVLGARVARRLCPRFGLSEAECETVEWLVLHHLAMSNTAFRRDLEDDKTLSDFADLVESPDRLRLLLILTTIDIDAVGPGRWSVWKATLIGQLFSRTLELLSGDFDASVRSVRLEQAQLHFRKAAQASDMGWSDADIDDFVDIATPAYWLAFDVETQLQHAEMARSVKDDARPLSIRTGPSASGKLTEVTVYTGDHSGLSSLIAGAITAAGGRILDARLFTLSNGMALDVFSITNLQDDSGADAQRALENLTRSIEKSLRGETDLTRSLASRRSTLPARSKVFAAAPRVVIDNHASNQCTVIEINGRDRPGILYELSKALTDAGLRIASAKITTFGERVVDVFYVKDIFGLKITNNAKLSEIRETLMSVIDLRTAGKQDGDGPEDDGTAGTRDAIGRTARERAKRNKDAVSRSMGGQTPQPQGESDAAAPQTGERA